LITVQGKDGETSMLQVQYPKKYSMVDRVQATDDLVLVNQVGFDFDPKSENYSGFALGMPWIYSLEKGGKTVFYTMQQNMDRFSDVVASVTPAAQNGVAEPVTYPTIDNTEATASSEEAVASSSDSGISNSDFQTEKGRTESDSMKNPTSSTAASSTAPVQSLMKSGEFLNLRFL
jgi:hypothetical protein